MLGSLGYEVSGVGFDASRVRFIYIAPDWMLEVPMACEHSLADPRSLGRAARFGLKRAASAHPVQTPQGGIKRTLVPGLRVRLSGSAVSGGHA